MDKIKLLKQRTTTLKINKGGTKKGRKMADNYPRLFLSSLIVSFFIHSIRIKFHLHFGPYEIMP